MKASWMSLISTIYGDQEWGEYFRKYNYNNYQRLLVSCYSFTVNSGGCMFCIEEIETDIYFISFVTACTFNKMKLIWNHISCSFTVGIASGHEMTLNSSTFIVIYTVDLTWTEGSDIQVPWYMILLSSDKKGKAEIIDLTVWVQLYIITGTAYTHSYPQLSVTAFQPAKVPPFFT